MKIMLLAPPGAGKGTQGTRLAEHFGVRHIAVGDLLRANVERGTELGRLAAEYVERGELVPDGVIMAVVIPEVVTATAAGGFVLDGFPRSMPQALGGAQLADWLGTRFDAVVYLQAPEEELVSRLLQRAQESGRADDTLEVIRHRLQVFAEQTAPLVEYYTGRGILVPVDGNQPPDDVTEEIIRGVQKLVPPAE
jgi:adenylate kinase